MKSSLAIFLFLITLCSWSQMEIKPHGGGICPGETTLLVAVGGGPDYQWIVTDVPDEILSTNGYLEVSPDQTTSYTVFDSADSATIIIVKDYESAECLCRYYIPNHFTPDGDNFNQFFTPIINCDHIGLHMTIYNREQGVVYDSHELYQSWDGTDYQTGVPLKDDVYVYQVSFMKPDNEIVSLVGFVLLLR